MLLFGRILCKKQDNHLKSPVFCLLSVQHQTFHHFVMYSLPLQKHVVSDVIKWLGTFENFALSNLAPLFLFVIFRNFVTSTENLMRSTKISALMVNNGSVFAVSTIVGSGLLFAGEYIRKFYAFKVFFCQNKVKKHHRNIHYSIGNSANTPPPITASESCKVQ